MDITICPRCKWKIKGDLRGKVCGYCQANERAGINPLTLPPGNTEPVDNITGKEIDLLIKFIQRR